MIFYSDIFTLYYDLHSQGRVKFPTGGDSPRALKSAVNFDCVLQNCFALYFLRLADLVKFQSRQYSLDERE